MLVTPYKSFDVRILLLFIAGMSLSCPSCAQDYNNFITGDFALFIQSDDGDEFKNSFFGFSPGYGQQLTPGWAVGGNLSLVFDQSTFEGFNLMSGSRRIQGGLRFWARRSLNPDNKLIVFFEPALEVGIASLSEFRDNGDWEREGNAQISAGLDASVGLLYYLSPRFRLVSRLGGIDFSRRFPNGGGARASTNFGLNFGLRSVSFGGEYLW